MLCLLQAVRLTDFQRKLFCVHLQSSADKGVTHTLFLGLPDRKPCLSPVQFGGLELLHPWQHAEAAPLKGGAGQHENMACPPHPTTPCSHSGHMQ